MKKEQRLDIAPQVRRRVSRIRWTVSGRSDGGERVAPEEVAVAIVHDGSTTVVMMATPADIDDLAVGFSLTEGIVERLDQIRDISVVRGGLGIEARVWLESTSSQRQSARRRKLVGPTGCGLCGIESLEEAVRSPPKVGSGACFSPAEIFDAMAELERSTPLGSATRATHAAALWRNQEPLLVREDVGRHNALDKLIGAAARAGISGDQGMLLLTSRVSVEMVQKAARSGAATICAVSAPTALAIDVAKQCGMTLTGVSRPDGFEVFCGAERISPNKA